MLQNTLLIEIMVLPLLQKRKEREIWHNCYYFQLVNKQKQQHVIAHVLQCKWRCYQAIALNGQQVGLNPLPTVTMVKWCHTVKQTVCWHKEGGLWANTYKNNQILKKRLTYIHFTAYLSSKCVSTNKVAAELANT